MVAESSSDPAAKQVGALQLSTRAPGSAMLFQFSNKINNLNYFMGEVLQGRSEKIEYIKPNLYVKDAFHRKSSFAAKSLKLKFFY